VNGWNLPYALSLSLRLALLVVFVCGYVPEDAQKAMQSGVQKWGFTIMGASIFPPTFGSRSSPGVPDNSCTVLVFEGLSTVNTYLH